MAVEQLGIEFVEQGLRDVLGKLDSLDDKVGELGTSSSKTSDVVNTGLGVALGNVLTKAAGLAVEAIQKIPETLINFVKVAMEAEIVMNATEATIRATGGAAGYTAEEIANLAQAESDLTAIDDEVIQSGLNMLLTFRNIGGDTLPRATRAMEDMAAAMAGGNISAIDLKGTAIQLGKALNNPTEGMAALSRVGVTFTKEQKDTIKAFMEVNDIASAQAVILKELEGEFGGMAEQMGTTGAGKIQKAQNALDNLSATIGSKMLPGIGAAADGFAQLINTLDRLPEIQEKNRATVAASFETYADYVGALYDAKGAAGVYRDENGQLTDSFTGQAAAINEVAAGVGALTESQWKQIQTQQQITAEMDEGARSWIQYAGSEGMATLASASEVEMTEEQIKAQLALRDSLAKTGDEQLAVAVKFNDSNSKMAALLIELETAENNVATARGNARDKAIEERDAILLKIDGLDAEIQKTLAWQAVNSLTPAMFGESTEAGERYNEAKRALMLTTGLLTVQDIAAQQAVELLTGAYVSGKIGPLEYDVALQGVKRAAEDGRVTLEELIGPITDTSAVAGDADSAFGGLQGALSSAADAAERFRDAANSIPTKINVDVYYEEHGRPGKVGGEVTGMAGGGIAPGGVTLVGERGPELVVLPKGSLVIPHTSTNYYNYESNYNLTTQSTTRPGGLRMEFEAMSMARR